MLKITKGVTSDFFSHTLPRTDSIDLCSDCSKNTNVSEVYSVTCLSDNSYISYMGLCICFIAAAPGNSWGFGALLKGLTSVVVLKVEESPGY